MPRPPSAGDRSPDAASGPEPGRSRRRRPASTPSASQTPAKRRPWWAVAIGAVLVIIVAALQAVGELPGEGGVLPGDEADAPAAPPVARAANRGAGFVQLFVQPDDGRAPILEELDGARESITLQIYLLSDPEIVTALERAAARGVRVRVIMEEQPFGGAGGQREMFARLERAGIGVRWDNPAFRFTHVKTFVVDGETALVMNQNLTRSSFTGNRELGVVTTRPAEVAQAAAIFETDWERAAEPPAGPLVVSPTTSRRDLLALIEGARRSLDLYAEVVRDREVVDAIAAAEGRGVAVRLIMTGEADGSDDNAEERAELARAGVDVRLASGLYIHAKMVLVDGARAYVGSQNFTATSLDQNRELGVLLDDRPSLLRLAATFEQDWTNGRREGER